MLRNYARILHLPQHLLWFDFPGQTRLARPSDGHDRQALGIRRDRSWSDVSEEIVAGYLTPDLTFLEREPVAIGALAATIRDTTADLMVMDFKRGGGSTRRLLLYYFREEVAPLLTWSYPDERVRRDVFSAAAETIQLLGWTAYDAGSHDEAKRYFARALRLAREADDPLMGGRILANLSHQANFLGAFDHALKLARAAQDAIQGVATGTVMSMFLAMEARARASLGDGNGTAQLLHRAEQLHESRNSENEPAWISYFSSQEMASEAAHCFRDLGDADKCREFAELSMDPLRVPPRTLGFMRMVAASGSLAGGDVEHAASLATEAISLGSSLQSARYVKYLTDFYAALFERDAVVGSRVANLLRDHYPTLMLSN